MPIGPGSFTGPVEAGVLDAASDGGGKGIRTPDLLTASQALYQLSYTPEGVITLPAEAEATS